MPRPRMVPLARAEAKIIIDKWRRHYNARKLAVTPHRMWIEGTEFKSSNQAANHREAERWCDHPWLCDARKSKTHARLLPAWKADRRRGHRDVRRSLPRRMSERALVHEPCRCPDAWQNKHPMMLLNHWLVSQPATVAEPETFSLRRSKEWPHSSP